MKLRKLLLSLVLLSTTTILTLSFTIFKDSDEVKNRSLPELGSTTPNSPTPIRMYDLLHQYSDKYQIPKHIAFNIAYLETRYRGPFDWNYIPGLKSYAGALGPMQIMPSTANYIENKNINKVELSNNLELNIKISMKLLRKLHNQYGNWGVVCGYYNTGRPMINSYASFCITNKDYQNKWVKPQTI